MHIADYIVLCGYFLLLIGIGAYCMRRIKHQEDYLMGGRGFGKLLQTFAAFGAGTGSSDPINTARILDLGGADGGAMAPTPNPAQIEGKPSQGP